MPTLLEDELAWDVLPIRLVEENNLLQTEFQESLVLFADIRPEPWTLISGKSIYGWVAVMAAGETELEREKQNWRGSTNVIEVFILSANMEVAEFPDGSLSCACI